MKESERITALEAIINGLHNADVAQRMKHAETVILNYAQGVCDGTFGVGKATVDLDQANYVAKYTTAIGHTNCVVLNVIAGEPIDDFRRRFRAALDDSLKAYQEIMSRPADDPFLCFSEKAALKAFPGAVVSYEKDDDCTIINIATDGKTHSFKLTRSNDVERFLGWLNCLPGNKLRSRTL